MSLDWLSRPKSSTRKVVIWPFYYQRRQLVLLQRIREAWGDDCTIQIYAGRMRVHTDSMQLSFRSLEEMKAAMSTTKLIEQSEEA